MPLLASDPHLGTGIPSFWTMQHLEYKKEKDDGSFEDDYMVGASLPGAPLIMIGKTKKFSWGITAAMTDVSDLYRETLDDSGN